LSLATTAAIEPIRMALNIDYLRNSPMKFSRSLFILVVFMVICGVLALAGCASKKDPTTRQIDAIHTIRAELELPELPLEFVEMTGMINSPSGSLAVGLYQDADGRKFFVNPETNQVVEIDARSILSNIPPDAAMMSEEHLKAKVQKYISATIPDFEAKQSQWRYEEGNKRDNYFFTWYGEITPGSMNRPFAQIGLHKSGVLFAYYNTLLLTK
jgi:hypothetical protein